MLIEINDLFIKHNPIEFSEIINELKTKLGTDLNLTVSVSDKYMEQEIDFRINNLQEYSNLYYPLKDCYIEETLNTMDFEDFLDLDRIDEIIQSSINKVNEECTSDLNNLVHGKNMRQIKEEFEG